MSETARTLIESSLRVLGVYAAGETVSNDDLEAGLESLIFMLRHWSAKNIRLYYTKQDTVTLTGAASYTIGSGGDCDTVKPVSIRGARMDGDTVPMRIIDEDQYRRLKAAGISGAVEYLWYSPEYPLGKLYPLPAGSGTMYLDSLKPLTEPTLITSSIAFPPEYDEAIKYNLAVRLADEYGRMPSAMTLALARDGLEDVETRNFAEQVNAANLEVLQLSTRYNIDAG